MTTAKAIPRAARRQRVLLRAGVTAMKCDKCRVTSDERPSAWSGRFLSSRHASRVTDHASAFTLIELLVVIAIIAVLASLIFPVVGAIKRRATLTKVETEMKQVATAIDLYKEKLGFYPPDNPGTPQFNQLYFELLGTEPYKEGNVDYYRTLDGAAKIRSGSVSAAFGPNVTAFLNTTKGSADDAPPAKNFLKGIKPGQYAEGTCRNVLIRVLTCSVPWPNNLPPVISVFSPSDPGINPNPWRYRSSAPTNNPGSYDLWADVLIAGKTNRISNWSQQPQLVNTP